MTTETPTQTEVRAYLAENFVLPDGTYPLRRECPCSLNPHQACSVCLLSDFQSCVVCNSDQHSHFYVYNDSSDALTEALEAKGWFYTVDSGTGLDQPGNRVLIHEIRYGLPGKRLSHCFFSEGHRGQYAMELAAARAVKKELGAPDERR